MKKISEIYESAPFLKDDSGLQLFEKFLVKHKSRFFPAEVRADNPLHLGKPYLKIYCGNYVPPDDFWEESVMDRTPIMTLHLFRSFKFRILPEIENLPEFLFHQGRHFDLVDIETDGNWVISWQDKEYSVPMYYLFLLS